VAPPSTAVPVPDPAAARDAALAYIAANYGDQVAVPDGSWMEENITEEGLVGGSTFRYTAGDWVVTVSFPVVPPDATIYRVAAVDEAAGFRWEGEVDAAGQVTELNVVEGADVVFEGISFSYDDAIAADVVAEVIPAVGGDVPGYIQFSFDGYALPETFHEPRIIVFSTAELEAGDEMFQFIAADIRRVLTGKPDVPMGETLPPMLAAYLIRTQVAYFDFRNGTGVRFLTQRAQDCWPINNYDLYYTFQGITHDGKYYVAAVLPISHPSLPVDGSEIPGGDYGAFADNFETYAREIEEQLGAESANSFTPSIALLDEMIQSIEVTSAVGDD
jgi:hypothetical protein